MANAFFCCLLSLEQNQTALSQHSACSVTHFNFQHGTAELEIIFFIHSTAGDGIEKFGRQVIHFGFQFQKNSASGKFLVTLATSALQFRALHWAWINFL